MIKILITGKNSYVGNNLEGWLRNYPDRYLIDSISLRDDSWKEKDFSKYDVVFHVAAMVHKKEKPEMENVYFKVNRDLPVEVAKKAKGSGVRQFILMSTMAVYGEEGKVGKDVIITRDTPPNPKTFYGKSKLEAENEILKLRNTSFKILVIRPPMIYGPNCPGNYSKLEKLAKIITIFPMVENKRSMLNIDKFCRVTKEYIDEMAEGITFPQDDEFVNTSLLVKQLAEQGGRKIVLSKLLGWIMKIMAKRLNVINKVFGNLVYDIE